VKRILAGILIFGLNYILCTCGSSQNTTGIFSGTVRIAQGYGIAYAPVYIMEKKKLLEKYLPGMTIEWPVFGGPAAATEALAANRLDAAFMGIPQTLIAWDKGIYFCCLSWYFGRRLFRSRFFLPSCSPG
jgi:NitT/TauT family transport system substrate-binding protein